MSFHAGLFAQVHKHMDIFWVRTQIFLIMVLIVQRWIICAFEQVSHKDMDVSCVRTQIFLIMILIVQRWIICAYEEVPHRDIGVNPVMVRRLLQRIQIVIWNFCAYTQKHTSTMFAQIIQSWKLLLSYITIRIFCACTCKFHAQKLLNQ